MGICTCLQEEETLLEGMLTYWSIEEEVQLGSREEVSLEGERRMVGDRAVLSLSKVWRGGCVYRSHSPDERPKMQCFLDQGLKQIQY